MKKKVLALYLRRILSQLKEVYVQTADNMPAESEKFKHKDFLTGKPFDGKFIALHRLDVFIDGLEDDIDELKG